MQEMPSRIEDYAIIADCRSAALVAKDGSIDWLCLPRIDSDACFAALLGSREHGRWQIAPAGGVRHVGRRYRERTLILETEYGTEEGSVTLVDLMPISGQGLTPVARFSVGEGERIPFVLTWAPSHVPDPGHVDAEQALAESEAGWREWSAHCRVEGPYRPIVERSLITLKALTYEPTGGIVAAATTSLPEELGGVRNWDYRICWLRDATFTLYSLMSAGFSTEARAWRDWLLRAVAGDPSQIQIMYGLAGERRLP